VEQAGLEQKVVQVSLVQYLAVEEVVLARQEQQAHTTVGMVGLVK